MRHPTRRDIAAAALALGLLGAATPARAQKIDLELFGPSDVPALTGCALSLWQADRDPAKDRFSYVFHETMDTAYARKPAVMKIAGRMVSFARQSAGGRVPGFRLAEHQHYQATDDSHTAVLALTLADETAGAIAVTGGSLTLIQAGKLPFRIAVKGQARCAAPATAQGPAPAPAPAPAAAAAPDRGGPLVRRTIAGSALPPALVALGEKRLSCDADHMRKTGAVALGYSETHAVWMVACEGGPDEPAFFVRVPVAQPDKFELMPLESAPGRKRDAPDNVIYTPRWDLAARLVTNIRDPNERYTCGTFETYRLAEGRLRLIELRSRETNCDKGRQTLPSAFPIVYEAR